MHRASALALTCAVLTFTAASCGESGSAGPGDPAALVPADAALYVEAAVQPQGGRREDALAAAGKIMRTDDPAAKLRGLIDEQLAEEGDGLTWERDFASWLGEEAGVWASNLQRGEPSFAVIVASADADNAKSALARIEQTSESEYTGRSYAGLDYKVDGDGMAHGIVDDFVVLGTESGFKRTADTRDGDKLVDSERYEEAIGELEEDRLGHFYLDAKLVADAALEQDSAAAGELEQFKSLLPLDKLGPITGAFTADGDGMTLDTVVTGVPEGPFRDLAQLWSGDASELLSELPGDAWTAFAAPHLGASAQSLSSRFAGAIGSAAVAAQVKEATGLDLQADVFSWIGDVGVFVRGSDMATLDGALVIASTDDARAEAAFGKIVGLIGKQSGAPPRPVQVDGAGAAFAIAAPGAMRPVVLARGEGRVVAAYGEAAATAALAPDAKLGDAASFAAAEEILGDGLKPSFLLSMPEAIRLAEALGATDAEFAEVRPYLETLGVITSGGRAEGERVQSRMAVTLR